MHEHEKKAGCHQEDPAPDVVLFAIHEHPEQDDQQDQHKRTDRAAWFREIALRKAPYATAAMERQRNGHQVHPLVRHLLVYTKR